MAENFCFPIWKLLFCAYETLVFPRRNYSFISLSKITRFLIVGKEKVRISSISGRC